MTVSTDRAAANHHERRAIAAETKVASVNAIHQPKNRKCCECGDRWPCRTARILGAK